MKHKVNNKAKIYIIKNIFCQENGGKRHLEKKRGIESCKRQNLHFFILTKGKKSPYNAQ